MSSNKPTKLPISQILHDIQSNNAPLLLATMPSGYAILNAHQPSPITGCCMLIPKNIVASPNDLCQSGRAEFFMDMTLLGDAIMAATGSKRINYLVLCNQAPELHGHCIPRFESEDPTLRLQCPFQAYDFANAPNTDIQIQHKQLHYDISTELNRLLSS